MLFNSLTIATVALSTSALAATAAEWAQCGGQGFTGPTQCASGLTCKAQNPYYSQCLSSGGSNNGGAAPAAPKPAKTTTKAPAPAKTTSKAAAAPAKSSAAAAPASGSSGNALKASFTQYGAGDTFGSGNCNTATTACGFYTSPGYSAAASQNLFGVGPGAGAGPACGTCYKLTSSTDSSGKTLSNAGNSIVVQITNLCPAQGNPLCSQSGLTGTNQYGANVNFDLCIDSGASAAFFGNSGVGLALGTAEKVDCSQWKGSVVH